MERRPERCDPVDPVPVSTHVAKLPAMSIDERLRSLVASMLPAPEVEEPTLEDLEVLAELGDGDEVLSEHQVMTEEPVPDRALDAFVAELSADDRRELLGLLATVDEVEAEKAAGGSAEPPPSGAGGDSVGT